MAGNTNERGTMVFLSGGGWRGWGELVYVDWVEFGGEHGLLDKVQQFATEDLLIYVVDATPRDVARFRRAHKADRHFGNWFKVTPAVMRGIVNEKKRERDELRAWRRARSLQRAA
jgi:hypothetical protein